MEESSGGKFGSAETVETVVVAKTDVAVAELTAHLQHALHSVAERMGDNP